MSATDRTLFARPLTKEAFAPFGNVIETDGAAHFAINGGTTTRFHDLAHVDVATEGGRPLISIFRGQAFAFPVEIRMMERHPLGSQAFVPLQPVPFLIVVAPDRDGQPGEPQAFLAAPGQGVTTPAMSGIIRWCRSRRPPTLSSSTAAASNRTLRKSPNRPPIRCWGSGSRVPRAG